MWSTSPASQNDGRIAPRSKTPRQHVQRNLLVECIAARLDAVPGWEKLEVFVRGPLRAQVVAAMADDDADAVLARIDEVLAAVRAPVTCPVG